MPSTWTTTLPTGTTKIRMSPNIFQDRWTNIQQGEVPSTKWQLARRAGNPGAIANTGLIFTKAGSTGDSELFYKDDAGTSNTTQLTTVGGIGAPAQAVNGSTYITLQSDLVTTFTNTQDGFCSAAGRISSNGDVQAAYKISGANTLTSTGTYDITFTTPLQTDEGYVVVVTPRSVSSSSERNRIITSLVIGQTAAGFTVRFKEIDEFYNNPVVSADVGFTFAVFMSRI